MIPCRIESCFPARSFAPSVGLNLQIDEVESSSGREREKEHFIQTIKLLQSWSLIKRGKLRKKRKLRMLFFKNFGMLRRLRSLQYFSWRIDCPR